MTETALAVSRVAGKMLDGPLSLKKLKRCARGTKPELFLIKLLHLMIAELYLEE